MRRMGRSNETPDDVILTEIYLKDDPVVVASEVAQEIDMTRQGVHKRLQKLTEGDWLCTKKPGRDRLYWLTDDGSDRARSVIRRRL